MALNDDFYILNTTLSRVHSAVRIKPQINSPSTIPKKLYICTSSKDNKFTSLISFTLLYLNINFTQLLCILYYLLMVYSIFEDCYHKIIRD